MPRLLSRNPRLRPSCDRRRVLFQSPKLRRWKAFLTANQAKLSLFRLSRLRCRQQRNLKIRWPAARLVPHPPDRVTWSRQSPQLTEDSAPDLPLDKQTTERRAPDHTCVQRQCFFTSAAPDYLHNPAPEYPEEASGDANPLAGETQAVRFQLISPGIIRSTAVRKPSTTRVGTEYCPWPLRRSARRLNGSMVRSSTASGSRHGQSKLIRSHLENARHHHVNDRGQ